MTKTTYAPFDAVDYLDNDAVIAEYLSAAIDDPNPDVFSPRSATLPRRTAWRNRERHTARARCEVRRGRRPAAIAMIRGCHITATGRRVVVVHVFVKKTQKTSRREIVSL
jgi:hypothetical protein